MPHWGGLGLVYALLLWTAAPVSVRQSPPPLEQREAGLGVIHVAYAADVGAFTGLLSALLSLSRSLERPRDCRVHLLVAGEDAARARGLGACLLRELGPGAAAPAVEVHALRAEAVRFNSSKIAGLPDSKAKFFKFYLADLLPGVDRVLYLDTDTIVRTDLGPLYRMPMDHALACVRERATMGLFLHALGTDASRLRPHMPDEALPQLQAGVLLLDLRRWRSEAIAQALEEWPAKLGTYGDQLLLSLEFNYRRGHDALDQAWNVYGAGLQHRFERLITRTPDWAPEQLAGSRILHFSGKGKPWGAGTGGSGSAALCRDLYAPFAPKQHCEALGS